MKLKFGEFYYIKEYQYLPNEYFPVLSIKDYDAEETEGWIRIKNATIIESSEDIREFLHQPGELKFNINKEATFNVTVERLTVDQFTKKLTISLQVEKPKSLSVE